MHISLLFLILIIRIIRKGGIYIKYFFKNFTTLRAEICRKYDISSTSFYRLNKKYTAQKNSKLKRPENRNVKSVGLIVEQTLDIQVLKYALKMTRCTQIRINLRPSSLP